MAGLVSEGEMDGSPCRMMSRFCRMKGANNFPAFLNDFDLYGLPAEDAELYFPDTVQLENRVFPAFTA
ncbi:hypothetical protein AGMMS49546_22420 [Spirochaetia bacterium]|nr:hypothetical protein AGMMS49546_22420 [Spirochaetia bacterium]